MAVRTAAAKTAAPVETTPAAEVDVDSLSDDEIDQLLAGVAESDKWPREAWT